ncbi:MAG: Rab family GTPase [Thiofilum sp.]|uniref:Rab family GTPase n=1 Tax=Thiofilum sp. TaxID=2212733 RepID=UPI0025E099DE|nr:Rab family GTPase [Thiofilum sp.]MBK8455246.1 GTP-binding protein [Thiofilum sp.]
MIQKKICLLGAFAVGKTSLIKRYVSSLYSDKYHTTVGVKIDKKQVWIGDQDITLMIWDVAGEDDYTTMKPTYIRGAAGCIIVIDTTRLNTLDTALMLYERVKEQAGDIPILFALNKCDLKDQWLLEEKHLKHLAAFQLPLIKTSAKEGMGVNAMFQVLAEQMVTR